MQVLITFLEILGMREEGRDMMNIESGKKKQMAETKRVMG